MARIHWAAALIGGAVVIAAANMNDSKPASTPSIGASAAHEADDELDATTANFEKVLGGETYEEFDERRGDLGGAYGSYGCQSACKRAPLSARKRDPLSGWRKVDLARAPALRAA